MSEAPRSCPEPAPTSRMKDMETNLLGHVSYLPSRLPGMTVEHRDGLVIVDSGLPSDTFNKVLSARLPEGQAADRRIGTALAQVCATGRPFTWWVGPCSRPLDLETRLRCHDLREEESELGMVIELSDLPERASLPTGTRVHEVSTPAELADFSGVLSELTEPPDEIVRRFFELAADVLLAAGCPMRLFVAYVDGEPAATSELFVSEGRGGSVAGVHMVATSPAYRRRGLGKALTWRALHEGRRRGCTLGTLQASGEGRPVYERLGFEPCGRFAEYGM